MKKNFMIVMTVAIFGLSSSAFSECICNSFHYPWHTDEVMIEKAQEARSRSRKIKYEDFLDQNIKMEKAAGSSPYWNSVIWPKIAAQALEIFGKPAAKHDFKKKAKCALLTVQDLIDKGITLNPSADDLASLDNFRSFLAKQIHAHKQVAPADLRYLYQNFKKLLDVKKADCAPGIENQDLDRENEEEQNINNSNNLNDIDAQIAEYEKNYPETIGRYLLPEEM